MAKLFSRSENFYKNLNTKFVQDQMTVFQQNQQKRHSQRNYRMEVNLQLNLRFDNDQSDTYERKTS